MVKIDIELFSGFCTNGLSCNLTEVQKAIRLGELPSQTDTIRRNRHLKIVMRDRNEREEIFKSLKLSLFKKLKKYRCLLQKKSRLP